MHRDMKPANILISKSAVNNQINEGYEFFDVKISDFGFANYFDFLEGRTQQCGSPLFMAPEILLRRGAQVYNHKVDIWALGIIMFKMLASWSIEPYKDLTNIKDLIEFNKRLMLNKEKMPYF